MSDEQLSKKIEGFEQIKKENPDVDVSMLVANALAEETKKAKNKKSHRWAYLVSVGAPPLGLLYAIKYYFSEEDEKSPAYTCVILTIVSILFYVILAKGLLSGSNVSVEQIQQINPQDIYELTQ